MFHSLSYPFSAQIPTTHFLFVFPPTSYYSFRFHLFHSIHPNQTQQLGRRSSLYAEHILAWKKNTTWKVHNNIIYNRTLKVHKNCYPCSRGKNCSHRNHYPYIKLQISIHVCIIPDIPALRQLEIVSTDRDLGPKVPTIFVIAGKKLYTQKQIIKLQIYNQMLTCKQYFKSIKSNTYTIRCSRTQL